MAENVTTEETVQADPPAPSAADTQPATQVQAQTPPRPRITRPHCNC